MFVPDERIFWMDMVDRIDENIQRCPKCNAPQNIETLNGIQIIFVCVRLFSSPEHEVLMVSYCGQWLSVVRRRVSCIVCRVSCVNIWCLHSIDHICDPILTKLCQNVCFDNIQAKFEYGSCRVKKLGHQVKS